MGLGMNPAGDERRSWERAGSHAWCPGSLASPTPSGSLGLAAWEEYPTLKMLMEMVMTK